MGAFKKPKKVRWTDNEDLALLHSMKALVPWYQPDKKGSPGSTNDSAWWELVASEMAISWGLEPTGAAVSRRWYYIKDEDRHIDEDHICRLLGRYGEQPDDTSGNVPDTIEGVVREVEFNGVVLPFTADELEPIQPANQTQEDEVESVSLLYADYNRHVCRLLTVVTDLLALLDSVVQSTQQLDAEDDFKRRQREQERALMSHQQWLSLVEQRG